MRKATVVATTSLSTMPGRPAQGEGAFVWLGVLEPSAAGVRVDRSRVRPPRARGRGRRQGPPAPQGRALRRHPVSSSSRRALRRLRGGDRDRRADALRQPALHRVHHRAPRRGRPERCSGADRAPTRPPAPRHRRTSPPPPRPSRHTRRTEKVAAVAALLRRGRPGRGAVVVAYLSGELRQRRTGVGWAVAARPARRPPSEPTLGVSEVDAALDRASPRWPARGPRASGSPGGRPVRPGDRAGAAAAARPAHRRAAPGRARGRDARRRSRAAAGVPLRRRTAGGDAARRRRRRSPRRRSTGGAEALAAVPAAGRPPGAADAGLDRRPTSPRRSGRLGEAAVEWKLDGIRVQVHRAGDDVSRVHPQPDDITDRVPEVVEAVAALPVRDVVLDGEAIALRAGRPAAAVPGDRQPGGLTGRRRDGPRAAPAVDVLLRRAARRRRGPARPAGRASGPAALRPSVPEPLRVPRRGAPPTRRGGRVLAEARRRRATRASW